MLSPDQINKLKYSATNGGGPSASTTGLVDDSSYESWKNGTQQSIVTPAAAPPDTRNVFQKAVGSFVDPVAIIGQRFGEAVGTAGLEGANAVSGGAVDRFYQHHFGHTLDEGLSNEANQGATIPGLGTPVQGSAKDTAEQVGGRALSTIALGQKGIAAAGAMFGGGAAMQNDKSLPEVGVDALGGALAGKVLQYGFGAVAPYIAKAIEQYGAPMAEKMAAYVPEGSRAAFGAFADKVGANIPDIAGADVLPKAASTAINGVNDTIGAVADAPFKAAEDKAGDIASNLPFSSASRQSRTIAARVKELEKLESGNSVIRKAIAGADAKGIDVKDIVANTDLLQGAVDSSGTIRTTQDGGAVDQLNEFIKPQEDVISKTLQREGKSIPLSDLEESLTTAVNDSPVKGGAKIRALKNVAQDIEGYKLDAVDSNGQPWVEGKSEGEPQIPLATVHDAKVDKYANIDYTNPESARVDKVIAKALKETVENNTDSVDAKKLNEELSRHYATLNFLEKLDGKKVQGGRLGKYFAQTVGSIVGSHFGPLGGIVGAEAGGALKGAQMANTFGGAVGKELEQSAAMKEAISANEAHQSSNNLGNRNNAQSTNIPKEMNSTPSTVASPEVLDTAHKSIVDNGGVTISTSGSQPSEGYAYAPEKDTEFSVPKEYYNQQHLEDFIKKNAELLAQPGNHIGGWESDGKVYLDVSRVGTPSPETLAEAQKANQLAVFDLSNFKEIPLGKMEDGVYTPLDEAANVYDKHSRENSSANSEGGGEGIPEVPDGSGKGTEGAAPAEELKSSEEFKNFPRDPSLNPADKQVEDAAILKYLSQKADLLKQYLAEHGNIVNTDKARTLFSDVGYNGSNSAAVHEAASQLTKDALDTHLTNPENSGKPGFFLAGSSGAGKTHSTTVLDKELKAAAFVLDGNLSNPETAFKKIAQAEKAGIMPTIVHTWREPLEAWKEGVVGRMLGTGESAGRVVPLKTFLENLVGSLATVKKAITKGVPVAGFKNQTGAAPGIHSISDIRKIEIPADIKEQASAYTAEQAAKGTLTKEQYEALMAGLPHEPYEALANKP